ncbi:Serine/threonine protein kinase [Phytophthora megakarya]|uniref:Serine/threonine protein kinase n=1 Tax=Phytophthora megakarya TaxID=4795 RepID=A0A225VN93_9STRA|nr:Serine/threonine protein kinase [Phytophthora megakarya]
MTSLMYAIVNNNLEIAKFLIKHSANVGVVDNDGSTALIYAARNTDVGIIKRLIKAGSDVNAVNARGETSLLNASRRGGLSIVRVLVESGANIDATDFKNRTPVIVAAGSGDVDLVRFLWKSGADTNRLKDNIRMLLHAAESGNLEGVRQLLGEDCDVNIVAVVKRTLLMCAAEFGAMEIVQILVENGADVDATDRHNCTPLLHAAKSRNWDVVRFLVSRGANVNISMDDGSTSLLYAARGNRADVVQFLVEAGADVNASDSNNRTPLLEAAHEGNLTVVTLLVNNGADVNYIGIDGQTALMHAAAKGNLPVVRFLTQSGAEINIVDKTGWTTLMHATQSGNLDVVQYLLNAGADVSIANNDGWTAIFIACTQGCTGIQRLLMQNTPHDHQTKREMSTQIPVNCFIAAFDIKLQQFTGSENIGGEYRTLWLDAEVVIKLFVPEASVTTFAHEVAVWHRLRHPNVIKLYGACDIGHNFFVCEWASNGSLVEYISACEKRGERKTPWKFLHEAALGLAYLHERKIVHGNLCSNSILVGADEKVKLADFHMSGSTAISSGGRSDMGYGSFCWQAPELLKGEAASLASDIYSFCLCVMAAEAWDPKTDPRYYAPVSMTVDLTTLATQMCSNDPDSRLSASAVVRELESLALQESNEQQQSQLKLEPIAHASEYKDGKLLRLWQKLQNVVSTVAVDLPPKLIFRELSELYDSLRVEKRPIILLDQFYELIAGCIGAINVGSDQYRILRLSSTKAQGRSMTSIYRRIDALWDAIGDVHSDKRKQRREEQRLELREAFISELSQTIIVLGELETDEARNTFVAFLKHEIDDHGSSYTKAQLTMFKKAYNDLNASLKSDVVATVPKWFLPWYELEIDGANFLAEGAFGEVYRAKWPESEVVVKQVKFTNSDKSDSGISHSLSATLPTIIHASSVEKTRKEMREMFEHEVNIWLGLSHPHVVRLFGACHIGTPLFACEYASNGSLDKYLRQYPNEIWSKLHEAALGVQYLHSRGIIHGDLKCNNIVIGGDNKAKVTDFGLSAANVVTGAWHWVAPECLESCQLLQIFMR